MLQSLRARWRALLVSTLAAFIVLLGAGVALGVVGGRDVSEGDLAFVARITMGRGARGCTGVLVDPRAVLTAASCFGDAGALHNGVPSASTTVAVGSGNATSEVTAVVLHPLRDVALLRLRTPISSVIPATLSSKAPTAGDELYLAGFGRTESEWVTGKLRAARFKVDSPRDGLFDVVPTGSDAVGLCRGDAGGPALRESDGEYQLAAVHHTTNQARCLGEAVGDPRGTETRLDDIRGWVFGNLAGFATGFELGEPSPGWNDTVDSSGGGISSVSGICCGLSGPELSVRPERSADSGERSLLYSGNDTSAEGSYAYLKAYDLASLPVRAGTYLSYWIYPESHVSDGLVAGTNSTCVAVDLTYTDGSTLRDSGVTDQHSVSAHPSAHCGKLTLDTWNEIVLPIGTKSAGKRIARLMVGYDQPANTGGYRGYIDKLSISDDAFNTGLEYGQYGPTWTNTVADGSPAGGLANVGGVCCDLTGPELFYHKDANAAHTGDGRLVYSGKDNSATSSYAYMKMFGSSDFYVTPTTRLSYWIYPQSKDNSGGMADGDNSSCVAIDLIFRDPASRSLRTLRDSGATDERRHPAHPAAQCGNLTLDTWNYVSVPLGQLLNGQQIVQVDFGYDQPGGTGGYRGYIDDIRISR